MKKLFGPLLAGLLALSAAGQTVLNFPWGQSLTAVATSQVMTVYQPMSSSNLVWNGDGAHDSTNWTLGANWTVSSNLFIAKGGDSGSLSQDVSVRPGQTYWVSCNVTNPAVGEIAPSNGTQWVQVFLGGEPLERMTNAQVLAGAIECGTVDRTLRFDVSTTNATDLSLTSISLYPYDLAFAKYITLYNAGSSAVYYAPNMNANQFELAYSNSVLPELPAGMTIDMPLGPPAEYTEKYTTLRYRTASGAETTLKVIGQ